MCKGSFGGCQGQPSARPWHLLIIPWAYSPLVLLIGSSLYSGYCPTLYHVVLFHRLPCDSCSACLLPTVHLAIRLTHIVLFYRLPVIHARLACSLPYTLAIRLTVPFQNCF